ncbi:hypothetical protein HZH68_006477 [Vespula germanica]|uniref:Uncharacterized protein n=1 Tax=Vespula germanica TaxID=30212 RepID=A0A834NDQ6_VESGE|nr:hypothetical protein HZH68_006477 [Vespula germanica]
MEDALSDIKVELRDGKTRSNLLETPQIRVCVEGRESESIEVVWRRVDAQKDRVRKSRGFAYVKGVRCELSRTCTADLWRRMRIYQARSVTIQGWAQGFGIKDAADHIKAREYL